MAEATKETLKKFIWQESCRVLNVKGDTYGSFDFIKLLYGQPSRHYHTWGHVGDVLEGYSIIESHYPNGTFSDVDRATGHAAVFLHDCIYDTRAPDTLSVELSAKLAHLIFPPNFAGAIESKVLTTKHLDVDYPWRGEPAFDMVHDADLYPLSLDEEQAWGDVLKIRQEFAHVPLNLFVQGRVSVMSKFSHRKHIFRTEIGRDLWEEQARNNIDNQIFDLQAGRLRV